MADRIAQQEAHREQERYYRLTRSSYGELIRQYGARADEPPAELAAFAAAQSLVAQAAQQGIIDRAYDAIEWDHKRRASGEALHHEIYDMAPDATVVCLRRTQGNKYGVSTAAKTYWLIERAEDGEIAARELSAPIAKYAKLPGLQIGGVIAHLRGEAALKLPSPHLPPRIGYKAVAMREDGGYCSVWDQSEWAIGQPRTERARADHEGGLYYYLDLTQLIQAAQRNEIFGEARQHHRLAVIEVEASGITYEYAHGKFAASRLTPIRQIASIL